MVALGAVGGDEVDQRLGVLQLAAEIRPAAVGLELGLAGDAVELVAHQVQRRDAGVAAAGDVQRAEVERQAEQVVLQRAGDELVDRGADLVDRAEHDVGGRIDRVAEVAADVLGEQGRVGEGLDQALLRHLRLAGRRIDHRFAVGAEYVDVDVLVQHRVAEAIHDVGELRGDRRIDVHVDAAGDVDRGCDVARELLEHDVLVFGLGAELRRLEQPVAVPLAVGDQVGRADDVPSGIDVRARRC